jgi:hypothetical protein
MIVRQPLQGLSAREPFDFALHLPTLRAASRRLQELETAPFSLYGANLTVDEFTNLLAKSHLVDSLTLSQIDDAGRRLSACSSTALEELCGSLVFSRRLTAWQCRKLLNRQFKGFVFGAYTICSQLSASRTHLKLHAIHRVFNRAATLIVLPPILDFATAERGLEDALREIRALHAPVDLQLIDAGVCNGMPYLVRDYVEGFDLSSLISAAGKLPPAEAVLIAAEFAKLIAAAKQPALHMTPISLGNIFFDLHKMICVTVPIDAALARAATARGAVARSNSAVAACDMDNIKAVLAALLSGNPSNTPLRGLYECDYDLQTLREALPTELTERRDADG